MSCICGTFRSNVCEFMFGCLELRVCDTYSPELDCFSFFIASVAFRNKTSFSPACLMSLINYGKYVLLTGFVDIVINSMFNFVASIFVPWLSNLACIGTQSMSSFV